MSKVQKQLESGKQPENVEIDTRLSIISPFLLNESPHLIQNNKQIVLDIWERSGIVNFFKLNRVGSCKFPDLKHPCNMKILLPLLKSNLNKHGSFVDYCPPMI